MELFGVRTGRVPCLIEDEEVLDAIPTGQV